MVLILYQAYPRARQHRVFQAHYGAVVGTILKSEEWEVKKQNYNKINGTIFFCIGLAIMKFSPVSFRGILIESWTGIPVCLFGLCLAASGFTKKNK
jgi:hypothetical protein